ncbi:MAG: RNA polymerase sigma factor [Planctomycetes bacterium]|nr:RNA polymerase sigma factor [Planctomycetota bacterium]
MTSPPTAGPGADPGADPDARAFAALVERAGARLVGLALALLGERAAAEDVVQEALARVWRRRRALAPGALDGYVRQGPCATRARPVRAPRRPRRALVGRATITWCRPPSARECRAAGDDAERVARALARLPDEQREVVVLRVYEGLEFKEIAARAGAPLGTIHSRYRLALERLRPHLEGDGD